MLGIGAKRTVSVWKELDEAPDSPAKRRKPSATLLPPLNNQKHYVDREALFFKCAKMAIRKGYTEDEIDDLKDKIRTLAPLPYEKQMEELGVLLYLLDHKTVSGVHMQADSLADHLAEEILAHAEHIDSTSTPHPAAPSGKVFSLLHTFVRLSITSEQTINLGGLYAIKYILQTPHVGILKHLSCEHTAHILGIIDQMIKQPQVQSLLQRPLSIAPSLEPIVQSDLKLPLDRAIDSQTIAQALILALFQDVRQHTFPNCYAISSLIFATQNALYDALYTFIRVIRTGTQDVGEGITVPLFPLVEERLIDHQLMQCTFNPADVYDYAPLHHLLENYDLETLEATASVTFEEFITTHLPSDLHTHAFCTISSHNHNGLCELLLTAIEFYVLNRDLGEHPLIERLSEHLPLSVRTSPPIEHLMSKIEHEVRVVNRATPHMRKEEEGLTIRYTGGQALTIPNTPALSKHIAGHSSLCALLPDGTFRWIETLTELHAYIEELLIEAKASISPAAITDHLSSFLVDTPLRIYDEGGNAEDVLEEFFTIPVIQTTLRQADTTIIAQELISICCEYPQSVVLVENTNHSFTLNASYLTPVLPTGQNSFETWKDEYVEGPATLFLAKSISGWVLEDVVEELEVIDPALASALREYAPTTYRELEAALEELVTDPENKEQILMMFDGYAHCIDWTKAHMKRTLSALHIEHSDTHLDALWERVERGEIEDGFSLFIIANSLEKALIDEKLYAPAPFEIEYTLCAIFNRPIPIYCGDTNYYSGTLESPSHNHLVLRYDFGLQQLCFTDRPPGKEVTADPSEYTSFSILTLDSQRY